MDVKQHKKTVDSSAVLPYCTTLFLALIHRSILDTLLGVYPSLPPVDSSRRLSITASCALCSVFIHHFARCLSITASRISCLAFIHHSNLFGVSSTGLAWCGVFLSLELRKLYFIQLRFILSLKKFWPISQRKGNRHAQHCCWRFINFH